MFAPLSLKQHRENAKFQAKEARESAKMENDESRKQSLHEIKLQEAAVKANQGIGHKEQVHQAKMSDLGAPLGKGKSPNKQQLGIPSMNPLAGTEVFKQGQHTMPKPMQYAMGTDTVPAMLTPGEAVIPVAAAQNPKNKKAIKKMVKEGRQANALRDGAVQVANSDAKYADGTSGVPSLAYRHPDIPGSSFEDGTPMVNEFSRGSAAQANYAMGTSEVPQQVQSAAGYANGTVGVDNMLAIIPKIAPHRKVKGYEDGIVDVPQDLQQDNWDTTKSYDFSQDVPVPGEGIELAGAAPKYFTDKEVVSDVPAKTSVYGSAPGSSRNYGTKPVEAVTPVSVIEVPKPVDPAASNKPVVPAGTSQRTKIVVPAVTDVGFNERGENMTPQQMENPPPVIDTTKEEPGGVPYNELDATRKEYFTPTPQEASSKVRALSSYVEELGGVHKTEKPFVESFKNLFSGGLKEELGLNNQDIIRMAISTFVGGKRFGFNRALAYAGAKAFEDSSKRNAQEQAQEKAIRASAVQMRAQDINADKAEKAAATRETNTIVRENARATHDRFMADQQVKMAAINAQYARDHDDRRAEQQMRVLAQQQAGMESRMQSTFGNQWAMMLGRETLKENSPIEKLKRLEQHTEKAAGAISEIYNRDLGSSDIKGQANPSRLGLPTPKQATQQGLTFLKRSGYDITNPDVAQEATAVLNQATEQMIADKKSGRVSNGVTDVSPYLARNVVTHRMGLDMNLFTVGNKQMPPEKISEIYGLARTAATDAKGDVNQRNISDGVNAVAKQWNSDAGKKYREQFKGTETETAFAQFLKAKLLNQVK